MEIKFGLNNTSGKGNYLLVPNINRSNRPLPSAVTAESVQPALLDRQRKSRQLNDKEIYSLIIEIEEEEMQAHGQLLLEVVCNRKAFKLLDQSAVEMMPGGTGNYLVDLKGNTSTKVKGLQFYIEAQTFAGSPLLPRNEPLQVSFKIWNEQLKVLYTFPAQPQTSIKPSDIILMGDDARAERWFIGESSATAPTMMDVRDVAGSIGVPLTIVPISPQNRDPWLQDQFQVGYTGNGKTNLQVVIHLPRMKGAITPDIPNLKDFVQHFFASHQVGLFNDCWEVTIPVADSGLQIHIPLPLAFSIHESLKKLLALYNYMMEIKEEKNPDELLREESMKDNDDLFTLRWRMEELYTGLLQRHDLTRQERIMVLGLQQAINDFPVLTKQPNGLTLQFVLNGSIRQFLYNKENKELLNDFYRQVKAHTSSYNYGGNVEVSPPHKDAPYGKIIAGSVSSPALIDLLTSRGRTHPYYNVYTKWLHVGHIDEVLGFVKSSRSSSYSVLRASPKLAMRMLQQLTEAQQKGVLVTRLFRGKKWIHFRKAKSGDASLPPLAYRKLLANEDKVYDLRGFREIFTEPRSDQYYHNIYTDDRRYFVFDRQEEVSSNHYAAFISCSDLLRLTRETNQDIEALYLSGHTTYSEAGSRDYRREWQYSQFTASEKYKSEVLHHRLDEVINRYFSGITAFPVPVLFDAMKSFRYSATAAIIPDLVNYQTLNNHVLVPRPYGARMRPLDAIAFIKTLLKNQWNNRAEKDLYSFIDQQLDEQYIHSKRLNICIHYAHPFQPVTEATVAKQLPVPAPEKGFFSWINEARATGVPIFMPDEYALELESRQETLRDIANYFKDSFEAFKNHPVDFCKLDTASAHPAKDHYDKEIAGVMDLISSANPGAFRENGTLAGNSWTRILIPENTVDIFELYAQLLFEYLGMTVHWLDSWSYHLAYGSIHCATNVLRTPSW